MPDEKDNDFDENEYLERLWACYRKGIDEKGFSEKDLFIALIADLLKQIKTGGTNARQDRQGRPK